MKKQKRWTNADLREFFFSYNDRYFGGKLDLCTLSFIRMENLGHTSRYRTVGKKRSDSEPFGIHISEKLRFSRRLWATTMIHEMIHLEQRNKYNCGQRGRYFNKRMAQLAVAGAFNGIW